MLKIFRINQFFRTILLFPMALVLNLNILFLPSTTTVNTNSWLDPWLQSNISASPVLHWLVFSLIVFLAAVVLNRLVIIYRISDQITLLPGLIYVVLISIFPTYAQVSSILLGNLFLIFLLSNLLYSNIRADIGRRIFNAGLILGCLFLLFSPTVVFIFLGVISIHFLRRLKVKDLLNILNGFFIPLYLCFVWLLLRTETAWDTFKGLLNEIQFIDFSKELGVGEWLIVAFIGMALLFMLLSYNTVISKKSIQSIRKINVLTWVLPVTFMMALVSGQHYIISSMFIIPTVAYFLSEQLLKIKKESTAELILVMLILCCYIIPWYSMS